MPIFDFSCSNCTHVFESLTKPNEPIECPKCKMRTVNKLVCVAAGHVWRGSSEGAEPKKTWARKPKPDGS